MLSGAVGVNHEGAPSPATDICDALRPAAHRSVSIRVGRRTALAATCGVLMSFSVLSPLGGIVPSLAGRALGPCLAIAVLLAGAPVTRNLRFVAITAMVILPLGLLHGDRVQVILWFAELIAVGGVLTLLDLTRDRADTVRDAYVIAASALSLALVVATARILSQHYVALGFVLAPAVGFTLGTLAFRRRSPAKIALLGLLFVGATASGSRASLALPIVALIVVLLVTATWTLRRKVLVLVSGVLLVLFVVPLTLELAVEVLGHLPGVSHVFLERQLTILDPTSVGGDRSLGARYSGLWPAAVRSVYEEPLGLGYGVLVTTDDGASGYAHNFVLEGGLAFGVLGLLAAGAFAVERFRSFVWLASRRPDLAVGGLTVLLGLMISGGTRNNPLLLLTLGVVGFRAYRVEDRSTN